MIVVWTTILNPTMNQNIEIEELIMVLTGRIGSAINRAVLRAFSNDNIDISTEQWTVLASLWREDKVTQQRLCELTSKDKPSITRLIDKLEKRNLVTRVADSNDRRVNLIHLTTKGEKLQVDAMRCIENIAEKALQDISDEDLNLSKNILKKIIKNLN